MAQTKATLFETKQIRMAEFAKALAHPARIAILEILLETDRCICGDITAHLPLAQSTVSQHLKALKSSGLIRGEIEGVRTCYCIDAETAAEFHQLFSAFAGSFEQPDSDGCC